MAAAGAASVVTTFARSVPPRKSRPGGLGQQPRSRVSAPSGLRGLLSRLIGDGLAARVLGTSTVTFLLGGAAWEWQTGYDGGIAARRGVAVEFVRGSSDVGARVCCTIR